MDSDDREGCRGLVEGTWDYIVGKKLEAHVHRQEVLVSFAGLLSMLNT